MYMKSDSILGSDAASNNAVVTWMLFGTTMAIVPSITVVVALWIEVFRFRTWQVLQYFV